MSDQLGMSLKMKVLIPLLLVGYLCISTTKSYEALKNQKIDFIVVGAGASGAAVAHRLAEHGVHEVLLLEAGEEPLQLTKIPYFGTGPLRGTMDWNYLSEKQEHACFNYKDQKIHMSRGKALGGSTAINGMVYTRGDARDYDHWKALGNDGWAFDDVLPYFKKMEDYRVPLYSESNRRYHGKGGPIVVSRPSYSTPVGDAFLEAGKLLGHSLSDYNAKYITGFARTVSNVANGSRCNTYDAYLKPALHWRNLHIIDKALVTKILFNDSKNAIGVIYEVDGKSLTVYCSKEVILCAGAINSSHLLMLSGIGPQETLRKHQIPLISGSPGVGRNLQDHVLISMTYTLPDVHGINHKHVVSPETMELWETKKEGPLAVSVRSEGVGFIDTKLTSASFNFTDLEIFMYQPPGVYLGLDPKAARSYMIPDQFCSILTLIAIALRPKSIGYITLRSSDPHDPPIIQPNYLKEDYDVQILLEGMKFIQKLMAQEPFQALEAKQLGKSALGCETHEHSSDDYFKCVIRHYASHSFHPVGTCKMGRKEERGTEEDAVVDNRLRVYGVKGLRVVDASIMPDIVSAHTMAPSIMIGEKGADMILDDWKRSHDDDL